MKVDVIRRMHFNQVTSVKNLGNVPISGTYLETLTSGWKSGARTRIRRHKDTESIRLYLDRCFAAGYMSYDDYDTSMATLRAFMRAVLVIDECLITPTGNEETHFEKTS